MLTQLYKGADKDGYVFHRSVRKGELMQPFIADGHDNTINADVYIFLQHYGMYLMRLEYPGDEREDYPTRIKIIPYIIEGMSGSSFDKTTWRIPVKLGSLRHSSATVPFLITLIPQEQYLKDILLGHKVALFIREKGLR